MRTVVAIPTLRESPLLVPLLEDLLEHGGFDQLLVMENSAPQAAPWGPSDPRLHYIDTHKWPFHRMWNWAWRYAKRESEMCDNEPTNLVLLNDDIRLPWGFVRRLTHALRYNDECWCAYPDYRVPLKQDRWEHPPELTATKGTYAQGGMWGCAFAIRAELLGDPLPPIDEQFVIWCGDDDLLKQIDLAGKLTCRVEGLALEHHGSVTYDNHPELHGVGWDDVERFKIKYGTDSW